MLNYKRLTHLYSVVSIDFAILTVLSFEYEYTPLNKICK